LSISNSRAPISTSPGRHLTFRICVRPTTQI